METIPAQSLRMVSSVSASLDSEYVTNHNVGTYFLDSAGSAFGLARSLLSYPNKEWRARRPGDENVTQQQRTLGNHLGIELWRRACTFPSGGCCHAKHGICLEPRVADRRGCPRCQDHLKWTIDPQILFIFLPSYSNRFDV